RPRGVAGSGVIAVGAPPTSWRYSRWSSRFTKYVVVPSTAYDPPPYSWTRVRTDTPGGVTSTGSAPGPERTTTERPCSCGRRSSQVVASPIARGSPNPTEPGAAESAVIGDGHAP